MKTEMKLDNYRIYDRTGGGATEDIYADSLDEAIEKGRAWIEDGDWANEDGIYRTITLPCEVGEIVYTADLSSLEAELSEYGISYVAGRIITHITPSDLEAGDLAKIRAELDGLATVELDGINGDGDYVAVITPMEELPMEIDEDATDDEYRHDCSGEYSDTLPECERSGDGEHDWQAPHHLVGGIMENPGVRSLGGTAYQTRMVCARCGCYMTETDRGSQVNPGEDLRRIKIRPADNASLTWIMAL